MYLNASTGSYIQVQKVKWKPVVHETGRFPRGRGASWQLGGNDFVPADFYTPINRQQWTWNGIKDVVWIKFIVTYGMEINAGKVKVMNILKDEKPLTILVDNRKLDNAS